MRRDGERGRQVTTRRDSFSASRQVQRRVLSYPMALWTQSTESQVQDAGRGWGPPEKVCLVSRAGGVGRTSVYQLILIDGLGDKKARIRSDATRTSAKGIRGRTRFGILFDERRWSSVGRAETSITQNGTERRETEGSKSSGLRRHARSFRNTRHSAGHSACYALTPSHVTEYTPDMLDDEYGTSLQYESHSDTARVRALPMGTSITYSSKYHKILREAQILQYCRIIHAQRTRLVSLYEIAQIHLVRMCEPINSQRHPLHCSRLG